MTPPSSHVPASDIAQCMVGSLTAERQESKAGLKGAEVSQDTTQLLGSRKEARG